MRRRILASVGGKPLPYDAEVEWIRTDELAYFKTGFYPDNNCGYMVDYTPISIYDQVVCGARQDTGDTRFFVNFGTKQINTGFGGIENTPITYQKNKKYRVATNYKNSRICEIFDDAGNRLTSLNISYSIPSFSYDVYILNGNRYGSTGSIPSGNVHSYVLTRGVDVEMDFVPVRITNESGVSEGAMYNRIGIGGNNPDGSPRNDGIFRNQGTGALIIGPDKT